MAKKDRDKKRKKKRLKKSQPYIIVEGCTEENYIKVLKILYSKGMACKNVNGGNAKGVIEKARKEIENNPEYTYFIIWFDDDGFYENNLEEKIPKKLISEITIKTAISYPCIEAWLLSHFEKIYENQLDKNCDYFGDELKKKYIPKYKKNDCKLLETYIDDEKIKNAKSNYPKYAGNLDAILDYFL